LWRRRRRWWRRRLFQRRRRWPRRWTWTRGECGCGTRVLKRERNEKTINGWLRRSILR
jgi:hypothetical protein